MTSIWKGRYGVPRGRRDLADDRLEEGLEDCRSRWSSSASGDPLLGDAVDRREIQLLVVGAQREEQLEDQVEHLVRPRVLPVDLVDDDDRFEMQVERFLQDELRAGQGSLGGIHEQEDAVHHRQGSLHLAAEIGVAGGVDDVDLDVTVVERRCSWREW